MTDSRPYPQAGYNRLIFPSPQAVMGTGECLDEDALLARLNPQTVMMMGDNPALPRMPERPGLADFFRLRMSPMTNRHLLVSAARAREDGLRDEVVLACLLHDITNGALLRSDHGYWGGQLIAPYVAPEVAFAVRYHQALRYVPDADMGYAYPESYKAFFGPAYVPPAYLRRDAEYARGHEYYRTARLVTLYDTYFFDDYRAVAIEEFADIIAAHFHEPAQGLGFDDTPASHMWRTMIWPNNFL